MIKLQIFLILIFGVIDNFNCQIKINAQGEFLKKNKPFTGFYNIYPILSEYKHNKLGYIYPKTTNLSEYQTDVKVSFLITNGKIENKAVILESTQVSPANSAPLGSDDSETIYTRTDNNKKSTSEVFRTFNVGSYEIVNKCQDCESSITREYDDGKLTITHHNYKNISTKEKDGLYEITFYSFDESSNDRTTIEERKYFRNRALVKREIFDEGSLDKTFFYSNGKIDSIIQNKNKEIKILRSLENGKIRNFSTKINFKREYLGAYGIDLNYDENRKDELETIYGNYNYQDGRLHRISYFIDADTLVDISLNKYGQFHGKTTLYEKSNIYHGAFENGIPTSKMTSYLIGNPSKIKRIISFNKEGKIHGIEEYFNYVSENVNYVINLEGKRLWENNKIIKEYGRERYGDKWEDFEYCYDKNGYSIDCE